MERDHRDAARRELGRQALGDHVERRLGRAVDDRAAARGFADRAHDARNVDDQLAPALGDLLDEALGHAQGRQRVGLEDRQPAVVIGLAEAGPGAHDPGVVDQHVDRLIGQLPGQAGDPRPVGHIEAVQRHYTRHVRARRVRVCDQGPEVLGPVRVPAAGVHAPAVGGEGAGEGQPDAPVGAGDQNAGHVPFPISGIKPAPKPNKSN